MAKRLTEPSADDKRALSEAMKSKTGGRGRIPKLTAEECRPVCERIIAGETISAIARDTGLSRYAVRARMNRGVEHGILEDHYINKPNGSERDQALSAIAKQKKQFNKTFLGGTYKTPRPIELNDNKPFCLIALGDPHLDNKGTDLEMWEDWIAPLIDAPEYVRGVCLGDMTDNWLRFLGFLYETSHTTREESYLIVQKYIEEIGGSLDCIVGGNHDAWANEYWLQKLSKDYGIKYRPHGITLAYKCPNGREIRVGLRHNFRGSSIHNPNHGVARAARMDGWRPNLLLGGDKHISGMGIVNDCETGKKIHCHQLAAFKVVDDYAEKINFRDDHVTPGMAFVIDPKWEDDQAKLITPFFCPHQAVAWTEALRAQHAGRN